MPNCVLMLCSPMSYLTLSILVVLLGISMIFLWYYHVLRTMYCQQSRKCPLTQNISKTPDLASHLLHPNVATFDVDIAQLLKFHGQWKLRRAIGENDPKVIASQ